VSISKVVMMLLLFVEKNSFNVFRVWDRIDELDWLTFHQRRCQGDMVTFKDMFTVTVRGDQGSR